jgi:hypothetical protein
MNRRGFIGAVAALVTLPVGVFASRSIPRFIVDSRNRVRFYFTPFGEFDWIEMPSRITGIKEVGGVLEIACVGGVYGLYGFPDQDAMYVRPLRTGHNRAK